MEIISDKTVLIDGVTDDEFEKLDSYVINNHIDKFKLRVANPLKAINVNCYVDEDLFARYSELLKKVESLNIFSLRFGYKLIDYCTNLKHITLPYDYYMSISNKTFKNLKSLESVTCFDTSIIHKKLDVNLKEINLTGIYTPMSFYCNDSDELIYLDYAKCQNVSGLKSFQMNYMPKVYSFTMTNVNDDLQMLTLVGNFNLTKINLSNNLKKLKVLRIYSNNVNCDFDANSVVNILRDSFNGKNKLNKFVFDVKLYPSVQKLLENDLKNEKFTAFLDNFAFVGEEVEGAYLETGINKIRRYDKICEKIIARCGVQKTDSEFEAFSKIYMFIMDKVSYNIKFIENVSREFFITKTNLRGNAYEFDYLKMLGFGAKNSSTFGAIDNDFNIICGGVSRFLSYLLSKVGISSNYIQVFVGDSEDVSEFASLPPKYKTVNHMLLIVNFKNGSLVVDPTYDMTVCSGFKDIKSLSFMDKYYFSMRVNNFLESNYYIPKLTKISDEDKKRLFNLIIYQIKNSRIEDAISPFELNSYPLTNIKLTDSYKTEFNHFVASEILKQTGTKYHSILSNNQQSK